MDKAIELIQTHMQLPWSKRDEKLEELRTNLKALGFYRLPVYQRESILKQAKPTGTKVSR